MSLLKGVENGASIIDTCNSSFSEGASHPTTESMVAALKGTEYDTGLDLAKLQEITAYFREVRRKYWQYESEFTGVDTRVLVNQVPGGMISNLSNQLKEQGALDRMDEVLSLIHISNGGGGRGIRRCDSEKELIGNYDRVISEASKALSLIHI